MKMTYNDIITIRKEKVNYVIEYSTFGFDKAKLKEYSFNNCVYIISNRFVDKESNLCRKYIHVEFVESHNDFELKEDYRGIVPTHIFVIPISKEKSFQLIKEIKNTHEI